jgi:hypothetical protein
VFSFFVGGKVMKRLIHHPSPYDDESLSGYLLRISILNQYKNPKYIYDDLSVFQNKRIFSYYIDTTKLEVGDLDILSELTCCTQNTFINLRFEETDNQMYMFDKFPISLTAISTLKAKVCPLCLVENEYFRKAWSLLNVTACPHHKVMMVDQCQNCSRSISWKQVNIFKCSCGHLYKNTRSEVANKECVSISELIYKDCGLLINNTESSPKLPIEYDDLNTLNNIILFFAKHISGTMSISQFSGINFPVRKYSVLQINAVNIINSWPHGFYEFLDQYKLKQKSSEFKSIMGVFGDLYLEIFEDRNNTFSILKKEFIKYILKNSDSYASANLLRIVNKFEIVLLSGVDAVRYLSISRERLIRLIENQKIEGHIVTTSIGRMIIVYKTSIEKYKEEISNRRWLSYAEALNYLGVGLGLDDLIDYGYLSFMYDESDYSKNRFITQVSKD